MLKHLEAENAYAEKHLEHVSPLVETLYAEIKNSIKESDDDAPFTWGPEHEYFVRTVEGSAYPVILRLNRTVNAKNPEVVLDVNEVAKGYECGIGVKNYNDVKVGDQIEVFETVEVQRSL